MSTWDAIKQAESQYWGEVGCYFMQEGAGFRGAAKGPALRIRGAGKDLGRCNLQVIVG